MAKKYCPYCGASMVEYKRAFSKGHADSLRKLAKKGGKLVPVCDLGLDNSQYSAFAKMRLWELVESVTSAGDISRRGGYWSITETGWSFLRGEISIPSHVIEYRMTVVEESDDLVTIKDMLEGWWFRPRVIAESRPH